MTKTCPDCHADILSTSQPNRMGTTPEMQKMYNEFGGNWPKEEIEPGRFVDVDPEVLSAALAATPAVSEDEKWRSWREYGGIAYGEEARKAATPAVVGMDELADWIKDKPSVDEYITVQIPIAQRSAVVAALRATPAVGVETLANATIELNGLLDKYWMGDNSKTSIIAMCAAQQRCKDALDAQPASPLRGIDVISRCMEILEDVPGENLIDRVHRIVDWHKQLSEQYYALSPTETQI